ncbi:MAG: hypothetical protein IJ007_09895 [Oscillospiraceae bacterium]|nr:hypothetical protein [Oscillospiraceae bacterium]
MTIKEICDMLRSELYDNGFEYGFIVDSQKYKPNMKDGFDNEYYHLAKTISLVQEPSVTRKEKIGTCVDIVLVMKSILDKLNIQSKIWVLYNEKKNKAHAILTFEAEHKIVYLELTPQSSKSWYGQEILYSGERELLKEYEDNGYDISDVTNLITVGQRPYFLLNKLK